MAKKKEKEVIEEPQVIEKVVVAEAPAPKKTPIAPEPKKPSWEFKDRVYYLAGRKKPLSRSIKGSNIYWFDEEKGFNREIKYCKNQQTPFVDEMKGDQRLEHIVFRSGALYVPKEEVVLQKILSLYHPDRDKIYYEHKPVEIAKNQIDLLEMEVEALVAAKNIDIEMAEAIMRVEKGSEVANLSSKELKRDALLFAKKNPLLFLELVSDENVELRNFGIRATEAKILSLSSDQRTFSWKSNGRKLMTVPFDEHPYSALAQWFKTDEGMEVYSNIEKQLSM